MRTQKKIMDLHSLLAFHLNLMENQFPVAAGDPDFVLRYYSHCSGAAPRGEALAEALQIFSIFPS